MLPGTVSGDRRSCFASCRFCSTFLNVSFSSLTRHLHIQDYPLPDKVVSPAFMLQEKLTSSITVLPLPQLPPQLHHVRLMFQGIAQSTRRPMALAIEHYGTTFGVSCHCASVSGVQNLGRCLPPLSTCNCTERRSDLETLWIPTCALSKRSNALLKINMSIQGGISHSLIVSLILLCCPSVAFAPETNPLSSWSCER